MPPKPGPSDEVSPFVYLGSTIGNAYFSGIGIELLFEAVFETQDGRESIRCKPLPVEVEKFKKFDKCVSAAINAKEWLEELVLQHGND